MLLRNYELRFLFTIADQFNMCLKETCFQDYQKVSSVARSKNVQEGSLGKTNALQVLFLLRVKFEVLLNDKSINLFHYQETTFSGSKLTSSSWPKQPKRNPIQKALNDFKNCACEIKYIGFETDVQKGIQIQNTAFIQLRNHVIVAWKGQRNTST